MGRNPLVSQGMYRGLLLACVMNWCGVGLLLAGVMQTWETGQPVRWWDVSSLLLAASGAVGTLVILFRGRWVTDGRPASEAKAT